MDIRVEELALKSLLDDVQATFTPLTADKGLGFTVEADPDVPAELLTDQQRLRQVLSNLLSNAVKFTQQGSVALRVSLAAGRVGVRGGPVTAFAVTDTGIGIAPDGLSAIFGAFQQGDGTLSRRYGGTGLGLSIAREVAALLGGEITADSQVGRGQHVHHVPAVRAAACRVAGQPGGRAGQPARAAHRRRGRPGAGRRLDTPRRGYG
jgi:signal transduction histidine kinase